MPMTIPPASVIPRLPHSVIPAPAGYIPAILSVIPAPTPSFPRKRESTPPTHRPPSFRRRLEGWAGRIPPTPLLRKGGGGLRHHRSAGFFTCTHHFCHPHRHSRHPTCHSRTLHRHSRESGNPHPQHAYRPPPTVIPAIPTVIPAQAGIQNPGRVWRGDRPGCGFPLSRE